MEGPAAARVRSQSTMRPTLSVDLASNSFKGAASASASSRMTNSQLSPTTPAGGSSSASSSSQPPYVILVPQNGAFQGRKIVSLETPVNLGRESHEARADGVSRENSTQSVMGSAAEVPATPHPGQQSPPQLANAPSLSIHGSQSVAAANAAAVAAQNTSQALPTNATQVPPTKRWIRLKSKVVSRRHARLCHREGRYYVQDTMSSSGTFVRGRRLSSTNQMSQECEIQNGDIIRLGDDFTQNGVLHQCVIVQVIIPSQIQEQQQKQQDGQEE